MRVCNKCKSTSIKSRTNYSHGKKSKATVSYTCKACGSYDILTKTEKTKYKKR